MRDWRKFVALLMLLWGLGDIATACHGSIFEIHEGTTIGASKSVEKGPTTSMNGEDDSFACCSHVVPFATFELTSTLSSELVSEGVVLDPLFTYLGPQIQPPRA